MDNSDNWKKRLQKAELEILIEIVRVCEQLHIKYIIYYGTMLGAVRHHGFIPWDDDIDIAMPREDYEIFVKEAQYHMASKYMVQNYLTDPETNILWTKVRNKNTVFLEKNNMEFDICHGIFVDIFPLDRCKKKIIHYKLECFAKKKFNMIACCYSSEFVASVRNPVKKIVMNIIRFTLCKKIKVCDMLEREDVRRKKVNEKGDDCYPISGFTDKGIMTYGELFETRKYLFEGVYLDGPAEYDKYLTKVYGDYMKLPDNAHRITHEPLKIVFEEDE